MPCPADMGRTGREIGEIKTKPPARIVMPAGYSNRIFSSPCFGNCFGILFQGRRLRAASYKPEAGSQQPFQQATVVPISIFDKNHPCSCVHFLPKQAQFFLLFCSCLPVFRRPVPKSPSAWSSTAETLLPPAPTSSPRPTLCGASTSKTRAGVPTRASATAGRPCPIPNIPPLTTAPLMCRPS